MSPTPLSHAAPRLIILIIVLASIGLLTTARSLAETEEVPEPYRSMPGRLQARAAEFPLVNVTQGDVPANVSMVTLNRHPEVFPNGQAFDAIRFRTPSAPGLDLVWAFVAPQGWRHWYILPVEGTMKGFRNWFDADRAYSGFDVTPDNPLALQTLPASSLKPDTEYLIWFSRQEHVPGEKAVLQLALHFAPAKDDPKEWDRETMEKALGLVLADAAAQAEFLRSRGARVLLDPRFFSARYAKDRIEDCLDTRRTTRTSGRYYVTMQIVIPPCDSDPDFAEIVAAHGEPDLVLPGDQRVLFENKPNEETRGTDLHFYDYFAFEVRAGEKDPHVERVVAQAFDVSKAKASIDSPTWGDVPLPGIDLRIFYVDRREVARVAFWGSRDARLVSGNIPAGAYTQTYASGEPMESLTYDGGSDWSYVSYYRSGPVYRRAALRDFRWHGLLTDYFEDGKTKAEMSFLEGRRHGALKMWDEAGSLVREKMFENGQPK